MKVISSPAAMQNTARRWRVRGIKVGFVPTMGYLHEGHMSLVREARRRVGRQGRVVVSIYVNPAQFAPTEDFSRYPRDLPRDLALCRREGVDLVFTPPDAEMYPRMAGEGYGTHVVEENLGLLMEGASRPFHFRGVTTVVAKLFNLVLPDLAVFGQKDFQQAAIIRRMVADMNFPVRIVVAPTRRERDGLAMSSRNKYLDPAQRAQAVVLHQVLVAARAAVAVRPVPSARLKRRLAAIVASAPLARLDYIEIFDPETLRPVRVAAPGARVALAVFFGKTRLIDNGPL